MIDFIKIQKISELERERERGFIANSDCLKVMQQLDDNSIDMVLTDIPYDMVNRKDNGLRNLDKGKADIITFDLDKFINECFRVCKSTVIIFCGINQCSRIYNYYAQKQQKQKGTVRQLIWQKSNPSPMNGQYIYLSGIENAIWFKKRGGVFNAHCKNTVFKHPSGRSKLHPTEKNHELLKELITDNSNENDIILDPCCGSGSHLYCARELNRRYIGVELDENYFKVTVDRLNNSLDK